MEIFCNIFDKTAKRIRLKFFVIHTYTYKFVIDNRRKLACHIFNRNDKDFYVQNDSLKDGSIQRQHTIKTHIIHSLIVSLFLSLSLFLHPSLILFLLPSFSLSFAHTQHIYLPIFSLIVSFHSTVTRLRVSLCLE